MTPKSRSAHITKQVAKVDPRIWTSKSCNKGRATLPTPLTREGTLKKKAARGKAWIWGPEDRQDIGGISRRDRRSIIMYHKVGISNLI